MALPTAMIAGVNKAGTTAVFHALAMQSNVAVSTVKETNFFTPLRHGDPLPDLAEYEALFPQDTAGKAVVEATPSYFYGGKTMAQGIDAALPGVRVAVILREPGARAYSWWRFSRSRLWIPPDMTFQDYLDRCTGLEGDPETDHSPAWRGLSGGLYSGYLPAWQETFGDRLLVLFYDDIRSDFERSMERLCAHFGIEREPDRQPTQEHNVTTDVSSTALQRLALSVNRTGEQLWRRVPRVKAALRRAYYAVNARKVQEGMTDAERRWLDEYFAEDVALLELMTRDLPRRPEWVTRARSA
jgi:hypothetical protein